MMLYCHDGTGIGHLRRGLAICDHVAGRFPEASMLLVTGTPYVPLLELPRGVDYVKLPALEKRDNERYEGKTLCVKSQRLMQCRRALLLSTVRYFRPSVFVVDKAPLGVCREMVPTLRWIQRNCPSTRVIFGMRDIEDTASVTARKWREHGVPQILSECFHGVWVYGMESICNVVEDYELGPAVAKKLQYLGYVGRQPCKHVVRPSHGERVLVTVGGGTDGTALLDVYCAHAARTVANRGGHSVLVAGPDFPPEDRGRLQKLAASMPGVTWIDHTSCMSCEMQRADLVVCMGGYNTMCEVVSYEKPALVVPRVTPRQEQAIRATSWSRLGLVHAVHPARLTPERLAEKVADLLDRQWKPAKDVLDLNALPRIGAWFDEQWGQVPSHETALRL